MNETVTTTTARPEATVGIQYLVSLSYLGFSLIGLLPNIILLIVIFKSKNSNPSQSAFLLIAANMTTCDIGQLLAQIFVAFPITMFGKEFYSDEWRNIYYFVNIVDTVCYNGVLIFTFVMSFNRFTVFLLPTLNSLMFEGKRIFITLFVFWLVLAAEVTISNLLVCKKYFSSKGFFFYISCSSKNTPFPEFMAIWYEIMRQQSFTLPIIMFFLYFVVCIHLRKKLATLRSLPTIGNQHMNNSKVEINMLIQGAIVCLFLELQTLSFTFLPSIRGGYWYYYSSLIQNIISILNNSISPYIYLYFNTQLRRELLCLMGLEEKTSSVTILNSSNGPPRRSVTVSAISAVA